MDDDLHRSRLTVFFRLLLALPHLVWLLLWSVVILPVAVANWLATLVQGRSPARLHGFSAAYIRYLTHVHAFLLLAANQFPGFTGRAGSYPLDVEIAPPARQNRWLVAFRLVLALPALLVSTALLGVGGGVTIARAGAYLTALAFGGGVVAMVAFLAWFACLARGRITHGFRNLLAYALRYGAQVDAYVLLLTDRYPDSNPVTGPAEQEDHPVRLVIGDDLRRSRLTVLFRVLLALPHVVWLWLWSIGAFFIALPAWLVVLIDATPPRWFADFLGGFVRYQAHVTAYLFLVANPFPGFLGRPESYPIEVQIDSSRRQNRWTVGFRAFLVIPAFLLASALGNLLLIAGILSWFVALVRGRVPVGLRNAGAFVVRYQAQLFAYVLLVTGRYPSSRPESDLGSPVEAAVEPA